MPSYPVHLVFSSGGVKCIRYIGAIQKLKKHNITIASVSTCSMGSIIGALVCSGMETEKLEEIILNFPFSSLARKKRWSWLNLLKYPYSIYKKPDYAILMENLLGIDLTLGELKFPFSAAALDIRQRKFLAYSSEEHPEMKVSEITKIATAIPPISEPYPKDKRLLVDAAVASESPVWMAANFKGDYPILVLKPTPLSEETYKNGLGQFLATLFNASAASHDDFNNSNMPRAIEININCGNTKAVNFYISKDQMERMIVEGGVAVEDRFKDFGGNFNNILHVSELSRPEKIQDTADRAVAVANQMMNNYYAEMLQRNQVFISYSSKDDKWLEVLQSFMKPFVRLRNITIWDDTKIKPGASWEEEIQKALKSTKVAVFLVTQNFLGSDYVWTKEVSYLKEAADKENVQILWIAVSSSNYNEDPLLTKNQ